MKTIPDEFLIQLTQYLPLDDIRSFRKECMAEMKCESRLFDTDIMLLGSKLRVEFTFNGDFLEKK